MHNESLKNKNETKKEECSIMCAQMPVGKIETALKWLNSAGKKFQAIWYNPWYYIQRKNFWLSSTKLNHKEKKNSSDSKNIDFLEIINLVCFFGFIRFGNNSLFLPVQENKFGSFHKSNLQGQ